jgi:cysteinyl-tRNA synthetase
MEGVRKELEPGKHDPRDFALWKAAKPGEPAWESPWGRGRPGWHIECSTMVHETLGDQIDIHLGGQDLLFPHHENEIAQSESYTGRKPFVRYWLHLGLVMTETQKMAHSLENFTTLRDMLEKYGPAGIRLYLLQVHYRSPMLFSEEALASANRSVGTLRAAYELTPDAPANHSERADTLLQRFRGFLDDDFNTSGALGTAFDTAHEVNRVRAAGPEGASLHVALREMIDVLGIPLQRDDEATGMAAAPFIDLLVQLRSTLRAERNFALSDKLRGDLKELGVTLEDTPDGTTWRLDA